MKPFYTQVMNWLVPKLNREIDREVDLLNINCIFYVSFCEGIIQLISLLMFCITRRGTFSEMSTIVPFVNVSTSILLCLLGFFIALRFRRRKEIIDKYPKAIKAFCIVYTVLLLLWGMMASVHTYLNHQQIITFYTVELLVVIFFRLRPLVTAILILGSYTAYFFWLNALIPDMIQPYNYFMMAVISAVGVIVNYSLTIKHIEQKNTAIHLNEALEIIANHDSMTRLQNRYALNQQITDYVGEDICLAIGDVDHFKMVNDTYGHLVGDDVLKAFAAILTEHFPKENVYRYGGDEFLIISRTRDYVGFRKKLDLMNEQFSRIVIGGEYSGFSCGFGSLSAHPENTAELLDLILRADKKLYEEKNKRVEK